MIPFALANWKSIAIGLAFSIILAWGGIGRWELHSLQAAVAQSNEAAAVKLAQAESKARSIEAAQAELSRNLDKVHTDEVAAIDTARRSSEQRLTSVVRKLAACNGGRVPSETAQAGGLAGGATGGEGGLPEGDRGRLERIAERLAERGAGANKLASVVRECISWAQEVGR